MRQLCYRIDDSQKAAKIDQTTEFEKLQSKLKGQAISEKWLREIHQKQMEEMPDTVDGEMSIGSQTDKLGATSSYTIVDNDSSVSVILPYWMRSSFSQ